METKENVFMPLSKALMLGPGELAFVGDAAFELLVREELVNSFSGKISSLHAKSVEIVCASGQARLAPILFELLDDSEKSVFMRGRNMKHQKIPHGCAPSEYSFATALECVFGYLCMTGNSERLKYLYNKITGKV
jgi:ribonuclease-3 family protein